MATKVYLRPSGTTIEVIDTEETRALAAANKWKEKTRRKTKSKEA